MSPFDDPAVLEESAAVWRRALARRAARLAAEAAQSNGSDREAS